MTLKEQLEKEIEQQFNERSIISRHYDEALKIGCSDETLEKYKKKFAEATGKMKGLQKALDIINECIG